MMVPPYCRRHSHTRLTNSSRPRSSLVRPSARSIFSTTFCVAMPAWSVPGSQQAFLAQHAAVAGEDVLDGVVERVPHVEHAGDVRRRDDDGVRRPLRIGLGVEEMLVEPVLHPARLDGGRLEARGLLQVVVHQASLVAGGSSIARPARAAPSKKERPSPEERLAAEAPQSSSGTSPPLDSMAHTWQNSSEPSMSEPHCEQCCSRWPDFASTPGSSVEPGV